MNQWLMQERITGILQAAAKRLLTATRRRQTFDAAGTIATWNTSFRQLLPERADGPARRARFPGDQSTAPGTDGAV